MIKIVDELVEVPGEPDAYYKVPIFTPIDGVCFATLPDIGRCQVAKEKLGGVFSRHESFAFKVVRVLKKEQ